MNIKCSYKKNVFMEFSFYVILCLLKNEWTNLKTTNEQMTRSPPLLLHIMLFPNHNLLWLGVYFRLVCLSVCLSVTAITQERYKKDTTDWLQIAYDFVFQPDNERYLIPAISVNNWQSYGIKTNKMDYIEKYPWHLSSSIFRSQN